MSNKRKNNKNRKHQNHTDDTLMDTLGKDNILPDGLLFAVDDTQSINRKLDLESEEKPLDL